VAVFAFDPGVSEDPIRALSVWEGAGCALGWFGCRDASCGEFTTLGGASAAMQVVVVVTVVVVLSAAVQGNPVAKPLQLWRQQ
jgi:hypothetical protein